MVAAVARDVHQNLCLLPMLGEADRSLLDFPAHTLGILSLHDGPLFLSILQWPQNTRSWFYWITVEHYQAFGASATLLNHGDTSNYLPWSHFVVSPREVCGT